MEFDIPVSIPKSHNPFVVFVSDLDPAKHKWVVRFKLLRRFFHMNRTNETLDLILADEKTYFLLVPSFLLLVGFGFLIRATKPKKEDSKSFVEALLVATMGYAQLVIGPAGSGKSTYCSTLYEHCETIGRTMHVVNLDPAAEIFNYPVAMDIRELVSLEDVMEKLGLGPNGGLMYCMEYLEDSLHDWVDEELENYRDDDYLIFDCPGQIELFTHVPVLKNFVQHLQQKNFNVCVVYLLDSQFITDVTKFISGCMSSLSAMVQLELPHVNILSKMDLLQDKSNIDNYLDPEPRTLLAELNKRMSPRFAKLNKALMEMVWWESMGW
ncbi:hypothetical protein EUTSA_v10025507mg [Eutrema salsugineum]|uniref:GPN-loop GTPase 3 n=1 Tax=Eutrema salsugineum TaxID=72664 RepID=V4MSY7_EUTSA|nr:hypothetical protein EUTSA_v10025507mg [Eutrema salsugineum]